MGSHWAQPENPGQSPLLNILDHGCQVPLPCKETNSQALGIRMWISLGGHSSVYHRSVLKKLRLCIPVALGSDLRGRRGAMRSTMRISLYPSHRKPFPLMHILLGRVVNSSWEDLLNPYFQQLRDTEQHAGFLPRRVKLHAFPWQLFQERNLGFHCWHPEKKEGGRGRGLRVEQPLSSSGQQRRIAQTWFC